jgi:hypothetical protein
VSKSKYHATYPTWWLLLVDTAGFMMDEFDRGVFLEQVSVVLGFDRVILLSPDGSTGSVDVPIRDPSAPKVGPTRDGRGD